MKILLVLLLSLAGLNAFASGKVLAKKNYKFEVTVNGEVVDSSVEEIAYVEVEAGFHYYGCTDDCGEPDYYYTSGYKTLKVMVDEEGYRIYRHSVPTSELSFKDSKPKKVIVALRQQLTEAPNNTVYLNQFIWDDFKELSKK